MAGKLNQLNMLRDENDDLKCQIEAFKNELEVYKQEKTTNQGDSEKEVKALQMAMQGMQQVLGWLDSVQSLSFSEQWNKRPLDNTNL